MIATDWEALAYQAAALSDTVRLVSFLRAGFLVWRLIVLLLPTRAPLKVPRRALIRRSRGPAHGAISHRRRGLVKGPFAEQVNTI